MKLKISLLLSIIVCLLFNSKVCAQTIGLSGPTTTVPSGTIVTFTATGESASKYIGTTAQSADASYYAVNPGVTCPLWETLNYFSGTGNPGKFNYKLINTNTVAKTVILNFSMFVVTYTNGSYSGANQNISYTVTIGPAAPVGVDPAILTKISNMGFATDGVKEYSDYYLVEDDIMLSKSYVDNYSSGNPPINITHDNVNILIDQSVWSNNIWYNAIVKAVEAWNSDLNCNIKIHLIWKSFNYAIPNRIDINVLQSTNPIKVPVTSRFPTNDGKAGHEILFNPNFKYVYYSSDGSSTSIAPTSGQITWNLIQAIGHCLGFKHTSGVGSETSMLKRGTDASSYGDNGFSSFDSQIIGAKYPLVSTSYVTPFISGLSPLDAYSNFSFDVSYLSGGITYSWRVIGIDGTVYDQTYSHYRGSRLPEESFPPGSYQVQCTISGGKYNGQVVATKNILVN